VSIEFKKQGNKMVSGNTAKFPPTPFPQLRKAVITINILTMRIAFTVLLFSEVE
jgi:hypothetical protein